MSIKNLKGVLKFGRIVSLDINNNFLRIERNNGMSLLCTPLQTLLARSPL